MCFRIGAGRDLILLNRVLILINFWQKLTFDDSLQRSSVGVMRIPGHMRKHTSEFSTTSELPTELPTHGGRDLFLGSRAIVILIILVRVLAQNQHPCSKSTFGRN